MRVLAFAIFLSMFVNGCAMRLVPAGRTELPHLQIDVKNRQVRVECETLPVDAPLEFFCVATGTSEHESVLRSSVKASDLHFALLMIGLEPGEPVHYSESTKQWIPPRGPPLHITVEYEKDGKIISAPAYRWMRKIRTAEEMPPLTWIFAGSRIMEGGIYAADVTGYLVSIVNFDLTLIDIPQLASNANETLTWQRNPALVPAGGTKVTMVIEPAGETIGMAGDAVPATQTVAANDAGTSPAHETNLNELRQRWEQAVMPHEQNLRDAAQTHYDVISALRDEQQRLIDEADRIQRLIDELEKKYQDLTTPRPQ